MAHARRPFLIDTDLSFDDLIALFFLLLHPQIEVRAITVVNGVIHVKHGVENARRLIALTGQRSIPVAGGLERPLSGDHSFPGGWRTIMDFAPRLFLPRIPVMPRGMSAPDLIVATCCTSDQPITIIALGPLTNLALALRDDPTIAQKIDRIYISGGAFHVPGTVHEDKSAYPNLLAEWNLFIDPKAAEQLFLSGIQISLIPLDVTHATGIQPLLFSRVFVRRLRAAARGPAAEVMVRFMHWWQLAAGWQMMGSQYPHTPIWDAAAAAIAADPGIGLDWQDLHIRIATTPMEIAGQTLVEAGQPPNARVCMRGDTARMEEAYLAIARGEK
jgi:pyrimidine-specific ribonucleoside hydrolase